MVKPFNELPRYLFEPLQVVKIQYVEARAKAVDSAETVAAYAEFEDALQLATSRFREHFDRDPAGGPSKADDVQEMWTDAYWQKKMQAAGGKLPLSQVRLEGGEIQRFDDMLNLSSPVLTDLLHALQHAAIGAPAKLKLYKALDNKLALPILLWFDKHAVRTEQAIKELVDKRQGMEATAFYRKRDAGEIGLIPIKGHLGDADQARKHLDKDKGRTLLEFTLKPGAHTILFDPRFMAIQAPKKGSGSVSGAAAFIAEYVNLTQKGARFPEASANEGVLTGYIGVKSESLGPFSLGVGKNNAATQLLFQLLIESVRVVDVTG